MRLARIISIYLEKRKPVPIRAEGSGIHIPGYREVLPIHYRQHGRWPCALTAWRQSRRP